MKLGFGFYRHMLSEPYYRFAQQCGCTHAVVHLVDYFNQDRANAEADQPIGDLHGWGYAGDPDHLWTAQELTIIRGNLQRHGMVWEAIENFDPAHWHDILLDGPKRAEQIENIKTIIRRVGEVGVKVLGYNFSIAGVAGRVKGPFARGGAEAVGMDGPVDDPIPNGMVWNMIYDRAASPGFLAVITQDQLWDRLRRFLQEVLPVAEEAGVTLALHPDDPPLPTVRGQPRLVYQPHLYRKLADLNSSPRNGIEFCVGTVAEMAGGDVYQTLEERSRQGRIAYVHLRNVRGKVPHYRETFIDDGEVDILRVLRTLHCSGFDGVIIPDHAPQMTCAAPWHAGMAFALGYLKALLAVVEGTAEHGQTR
jgi:mannonate dehydratase